jgi:hypothetical protein
LQFGGIEKINRQAALVGSLDGSDDLLVLEMELVTNSSKLSMGQGDVDVFGEERHS